MKPILNEKWDTITMLFFAYVLSHCSRNIHCCIINMRGCKYEFILSMRKKQASLHAMPVYICMLIA